MASFCIHAFFKKITSEDRVTLKMLFEIALKLESLVFPWMVIFPSF